MIERIVLYRDGMHILDDFVVVIEFEKPVDKTQVENSIMEYKQSNEWRGTFCEIVGMLDDKFDVKNELWFNEKDFVSL